MASLNGNLSQRGEVFATPTSKMPMLDVVNDLWHAETNSDGYISLGVAENVHELKARTDAMADT